MTFMALAQNRYSVRNYANRPVENEKINQILEAASLAPTACNLQPLKILVLQSKDALDKLKDCTPFHFEAPLAFLVCYDRQTVWKRPFDQHDSGDIDASIVGTHMMLAATEMGIGSVWVMHFDPQKIRKSYNIPDNLEPVALFPMGYPAPDAVPHVLHTSRQPIENIVTYDSF